MGSANRMTYSDVTKITFASGLVPDGYFGDKVRVRFALAPSGCILAVTDCGFFNSGLPLAQDHQEALWLLRNHPTSRATKVTV